MSGILVSIPPWLTIANKKTFNIVKYYNWLEVNEWTPVTLKLRVLYNCMFSSILYSCETWGNIITKLGKKILLVERKALKRILGVKSGTTNNLRYQELDIPDSTTS